MPHGGGSRGKVLVVDDSRVVREQVALALRGAGFEVVEASNGAQALALVKEGREAQSTAFSLAVCDVNMPVMGGSSCSKRSRAAGS